MKRVGGWLSLVSLLGLCLLGATLGGCESNEVELTIFHTNDIHLHYLPSKVDPFGLGGMARLSTLLKQERAKADVSLTIDAGDWSEGTWYYDLDTGANMLRLLDRMKYDAVALGNHDFLSGPKRVTQTIQEAKPSYPVLAGNLDASAYGDHDSFDKAILPYTIKDVGGLKVGIIGLTTYELVYNSYLAPVKITNPVDAATAMAKKLRPQVDVLLLVSHNAFETNMELARAVPGIDAVISGHSHRKLSKAVIVKNAGRDVPVVEVYCWGRFLGELKLVVDKTNHSVRMKSWTELPVSPEIPEDPAVADYVHQQDALLSQKAGRDVHEEVAETDFDLPHVDSWETPLGNLMVKAYRHATGADLALGQTSFTSVGLASGKLDVMDLHDVMPHIFNPVTGKEWTVKIWNARGSDISLVMTIFYSLSSYVPLDSPIGWLLVDNATVVWDPGKATHASPIPIRSIQIAGRALDPAAWYRVALSEGLIYAIQQANQEFHLGVDLSQITDTGIEAWQAIVNYAQSVAKLPLDELRVGKRVIPQGMDLGVFGYGTNWDKKQLTVDVENLGLAPSQQGTLTCWSGEPNNLVVFGTPEQKWTEIGHAQIPALPPNGTNGHQVDIALSWDASKMVPGAWPVRCQVSSSGDHYAPDNTVEKVFHLAAAGM